MKITVIGCGYVGLSLAVFISQKYNVVAMDICSDKVNMINKRISPINDKDIRYYLKNYKLNLRATTNFNDAIYKSNYVIICTPTTFDEKTKQLDTSIVEETIKKIVDSKTKTTIIIKSTVPIGFTEEMKNKYHYDYIIFSPEFSREGKALYDNFNPSRIIIGGRCKESIKFAEILINCSNNKDIIVKHMDSKEAEAVKLFSNTYLALRIAYFNELDTYAEVNNLNTQDIIEGVCLDSRIGNYYNNPSFGYGGYCLPKDTKQLLSCYENIPQSLIGAIVKSNEIRKSFISEQIINKKYNTIGIYRLTMKKGSDNFRESAVFEIMKDLEREKVNIIVYEPIEKEQFYNNYKIVNNLDEFISLSDVIVANRVDDNVMVNSKLYTRDLYKRD